MNFTKSQFFLESKKRPLSFFNRKLLLILCCIVLSSCQKDSEETIPKNSIPVVNSLFTNSIVSTEIDFITSIDADAFISLTYIGQEDKEMPDSRNNNLFDTDTYVFEASFSNGKIVEIWAHSSFNNQGATQEYANKLTSRLGKLPEFMRDKLSHAIIHNGDAGAFSDAEGHFIVLYSDNMDTRISNNDLEETVFHETVHASLDAIYATSTAWEQAQTNDGNFITEYGEEFPIREDLAESAIFAYTMIANPGRLSSDIEEWVNTNIPNRLAFFRTIYQ